MSPPTVGLPQVAISGGVPNEQIAALTERLPGLRVVTVGLPGPWPPEAAGSEVLFTAGLTHEQLRAAVRRLPELRWVHTASSGIDRIVVPEVVDRRLHLTRTVDARAEPMGEHVVAMALALTKNVPALIDAQRERRWSRREAGTLVGAQVVVVGAGAVGRAAARRFGALGARPIGIKRRPVELPEFDAVVDPSRVDDFLPSADVVVLACPLTPATRHLVGRKRIDTMKPTANLINVSRGAILVERELTEALEAGRIAGAALDVFEQEPLPEDSPLWRLPNVIVSPHCSGAVPGVWDAVTAEFAANVERWASSLPLANEVHPDEA